MLLKVTDAISDRITIHGFAWYFGAAAMIAIVQTLAEWIVGKLI